MGFTIQLRDDSLEDHGIAMLILLIRSVNFMC